MEPPHPGSQGNPFPIGMTDTHARNKYLRHASEVLAFCFKILMMYVCLCHPIDTVSIVG